MVKYILNIEALKCLFFTVPKGDITQDIQTTLGHVNAILNIIRAYSIFSGYYKLIILSNNIVTYSSIIFHVIVFDVIASSC